MNGKMQHTMDVFREYEKRFLDAQANLNENLSKEEIIASLESVLGINEQMIPTVHDMKVVCECEKHADSIRCVEVILHSGYKFFSFFVNDFCTFEVKYNYFLSHTIIADFTGNAIGLICVPFVFCRKQLT